MGLGRDIGASGNKPTDPPSSGWATIMGLGAIMLLVSYIAAALVAIPYFGDIERGVFSRGYPDSVLWLLTGITILHWIANIYLSVDEHEHPTRLLPFLRDLGLYCVLPVLPLVGVLLQADEVDRDFWGATHQAFPEYVPLVLFATILFCPVVTFWRLRTVALRISKRRLAGQIAIAAVGIAISFAFFGTAQAIVWSRGFYVIDSNWLALVFVLIPRALLMLFSLWSLYVLFELSGLLMRFGRDRVVRSVARVGVQ